MKVRCDNCHKIFPDEQITVKSTLTSVLFVCDECFKKYGLDI